MPQQPSAKMILLSQLIPRIRHTVCSVQHQALCRWDVSFEAQPALIYQQQQVIPKTSRQHPKFRDRKVTIAQDQLSINQCCFNLCCENYQIRRIKGLLQSIQEQEGKCLMGTEQSSQVSVAKREFLKGNVKLYGTTFSCCSYQVKSI